jgi:selenide, water dikinase
VLPLALNLPGWPKAVFARLLSGGARTADDAGALLAGGHSIVDPVP